MSTVSSVFDLSSTNGLTLLSELIWSVYAFVSALEDCNKPEWADLLAGWQGWMDYVKTTAKTVSTFH